ncbi:MAG: SRPBCC family protein [Solirubrobacterales bacterium]
MTVISSNPDRENLEMTVVAEFKASPERVWQVWEDPRKLEKWWGPPGYPATFEKHEFKEGGIAHYYMTSPEGEKHWGSWRFLEIDGPGRLKFEDAFADGDGGIDDGLPHMTMLITIEADGDVTRMSNLTSFESLEDLETVLEMGMEEGLKQALGQVDDLV